MNWGLFLDTIPRLSYCTLLYGVLTATAGGKGLGLLLCNLL
jgi:hypothetical protein